MQKVKEENMSVNFDTELETASYNNCDETEEAPVLPEDEIPCKRRREEEENLSNQVFSIPLILKDILKRLDYCNLLRTSLVNKRWNFLSREILRDRCVKAAIRFGNSCSDLKRFNALLATAENVPSMGLSIVFTYDIEEDDEFHHCIEYNDLSEFWGNIPSKICVKEFKVDWNQDVKCVAVDIVRKVFGDGAKSLEVVSLEEVPRDIVRCSDFLGLSKEDHWLPNVRVLMFEPGAGLNDYPADMPASVVEEMIQAAPNLVAIHGRIGAERLKFLLERNLGGTLSEFHYQPTSRTPDSEEWVRKFALNKPQLWRLCFSTEVGDENEDELEFSEWMQVDQEYAAQNLRLIVENCENLWKFDTSHLDLILMTSQWDIPGMGNLHEMTLLYDSRMDEDAPLPSLSKLDWSKHFPKLREVTIVNHLSHPDTDVEFYINENFRHSAAQFSCESVVNFTIEEYKRDGSHRETVDLRQLQMFVKVFPSVRGLCIDIHRTFSEIMTELWTMWPDLRRVSVTTMIEFPFCNFDNIFTGLSPSETGFIYENFEDERCLETAPIRPCLMNLPKLEHLYITLIHPENSCSDIRCTPELVFLSRVADQCAFSRMPDLRVDVVRTQCIAENKCYLALHHLKEIVELTRSG